MIRPAPRPPEVGPEAFPSAAFFLIAGPCVVEPGDVLPRVADRLARLAARVPGGVIFKASFDKANRSSIHSPRGPGLARGVEMLAAMGERLRSPVTTDIHDPSQAEPAAQVVDLLQIPAFLCRQTDLLAAAAATGRAVNVKKGQFMSAAEMRNALEKLREAGAARSMLTERGTSFGYNRLVSDFIGVADMMDIGRAFAAPTCFDATHSTQLPGGDRTTTGGRPDRCAQLARAAVAVGVDAIFLECHPDPKRSSSDASTIQPLEAVRPLLSSLVALRGALATV